MTKKQPNDILAEERAFERFLYEHNRDLYSTIRTLMSLKKGELLEENPQMRQDYGKIVRKFKEYYGSQC